MPQKLSFKGRVIDGFIGKWPNTTISWMAVAFFVAAALATIVLLVFGTGDRGTSIALRATARWSFLLFWLAYTGSAMERLFGNAFAQLARRGRDFGLAFASAQVVHVFLVLWLIYLTPGPTRGMVFFWVGILCTYVLAILSLPRLHSALGARAWTTLRTAATEYIALAFAADFILLRLGNGLHKYPLSYVPFALLLVIGAKLRVAANLKQLQPFRPIQSNASRLIGSRFSVEKRKS